MRKLSEETNWQYLNPNDDPIIQSYLREIKRLENEFFNYLSFDNNDPNIINWYEVEINLKWDNLRFYKEHMGL